VHHFLFARGGELRDEEQFPSTRCRSWLLPQLAATVVVLPSVEHRRTTNSSELEIYMYVGNQLSQLFVNKMKVTVRESNPSRGDIFRTCPDWPGTHPDSCTMCTGCLSQGLGSRNVALNTHPCSVEVK